MSETINTTLRWIPGLPLAVGVVLFVVGHAMPRWLVAAITVLAQLLSGLLILLLIRHALYDGAWELTRFDGAVYVDRLVGGSWGMLCADTLALALSAALSIGGLVGLAITPFAWGGGPRRENTPAGNATLLAQLFAMGLVQLCALGASLPVVAVGVVGASVAGYALLLAARPHRDEIDAASAVFVVHRVGDVCFFLAIALMMVVFKSSDVGVVVEQVTNSDVPWWTRLDAGPMAGYALYQIYAALSVLLTLTVLSRLLPLPLSSLAKRTQGAPLPTLLVVHGICFLGAGLALLIRVMPLINLNAVVLYVAGGVAIVSALVLALSALVSRSAIQSDLAALYALALGCFSGAMVGEVGGACLGTCFLLVIALANSAPMGGAIEALQGQNDLYQMGGLWKALRYSDRVRAMGASAMTLLLPFVVVKIAWAALASPRPNALVAFGSLGLTFLLSLVGWRSLHLAFTGESTRGPAPAVLVEVSWWRALVPAVALVGGGVFFVLNALPAALGEKLLPNYAEQFTRFLHPALLPTLRTFGLMPMGPSLGVSGSALNAVLVVSMVLPMAAFGLSSLLYRKGPSARLERLQGSAGFGKITIAFDEMLWLYRAVAMAMVPVLALGRFSTSWLNRIVLNAALFRLSQLPVAISAVFLRVLHNGDVQRGVLLIVLALAVVLGVWGIR